MPRGTCPAEDHGQSVIVVDAPIVTFSQQARQRRIRGHKHPLHLITFEGLPPLPASQKGLRILLNESFPVKVVAVVEVDFRSWIELVNQITAPGIGAEKMIANTSCRDELGCFYGKGLLIKMGGENLFRKHPPTVQD